MAWRRQAFVREANALEALGEFDAAVASYYDAMESLGGNLTGTADANLTSVSTLPDFDSNLWYYRAGFGAAKLLCDHQHWSAAASIYEKIVEQKGPLANEAKGQLQKLRLEHFVWTE